MCRCFRRGTTTIGVVMSQKVNITSNCRTQSMCSGLRLTIVQGWVEAYLYPSRTSALHGGRGFQQHAPADSTSRKEPVPIVQHAGWAPRPVWMGRKSRPHRDLIPDHPAGRQLFTDWPRQQRPVYKNDELRIFKARFDIRKYNSVHSQHKNAMINTILFTLEHMNAMIDTVQFTPNIWMQW
jgi:hypothetical protein